MSNAGADTATATRDDRPASYLDTPRGVASWAAALDHKRIALLYLVSLLTLFLVAAGLALLVRLELLTPEGSLFSHDVHGQLLTLHGAMMIFVFIVPAIPTALGNFVLPLMLGARNVAFPRLNLTGFYVYLVGTSILLCSIVAGPIDTGWTFHTPCSDPEVGSRGCPIIWALLGVSVLALSAMLTGVNFIATIHRLRAPGVTRTRIPLFVWSLYLASAIQILVAPALFVALALLALERALGVGIFDAALGGDPILLQHFFWFYAHPAVYATILPALGIVSELTAVHSRRRITSLRLLLGSSLALAAIVLFAWGQHMFVSGQSELASTLFSALGLSAAIPVALMVSSLVAPLSRGSISWNAPMIYALMFLLLITIGGLSGLFLGSLATGVHLHGTCFVVAHLHYLLLGGTAIALVGGLHHWWPKISGRTYSEFWARIAAAFVFVGLNLTFFSQLVLGSHGMPRRYHSYHRLSEDLLGLFRTWHTVSTVGSQILAIGLGMVLCYLLASLVKGPRAPANPWGGRSLEWQTAAPPPPQNFDGLPRCEYGPYELDEINPDDRGAGASPRSSDDRQQP